MSIILNDPILLLSPIFPILAIFFTTLIFLVPNGLDIFDSLNIPYTIVLQTILILHLFPTVFLQPFNQRLNIFDTAGFPTAPIFELIFRDLILPFFSQNPDMINNFDIFDSPITQQS